MIYSRRRVAAARGERPPVETEAQDPEVDQAIRVLCAAGARQWMEGDRWIIWVPPSVELSEVERAVDVLRVVAQPILSVGGLALTA